jgi:TonB-dependent starch-binding outer membrane protein SusC
MIAMSIRYAIKALSMIAFIAALSLNALSQKNISGKIMGAENNPVAGATVKVKGKSTTVSSGVDGSFSINAADGATLVISSIGFETQEVKVTGDNLMIQLKTETKTLSDVIVVGYGTQKRRSVTGAISQVTTKDINALPVTDVRQALQGRAPGVTVVNNGSPGESPIIRIRGIGSVNFSSDPFYVIDGIPGTDLGMIDSRDIESLEVLRDASTAAIYGSRAANGVVLVTTKKSKNSNNKLQVNYDAYYGIQQPWKYLDLLNTDEYIRYATALRQGAGQALPARFSKLDEPVSAGASQTYRQTNTNWQREIFRSAPITHHHISLSNGTETSRWYASMGYVKQDGIMLGTSYERYNLRFNSEHYISKVFTFGQNLTIANETKVNENNGGGRTQIKHTIQSVPYIPVTDPTLLGGYRGPSGDDGSDPQNPVRLALQDISRNNLLRILGNAYLEAKILKGLKYRFTAGVNYGNFSNRGNFPIYNESFNARAQNRVEQSQSTFRSLYLSNQLSYEKTFGKHAINFVGVAERQDDRGRSLFGGGSYQTNLLTQVTNSLSDPSLNGGLGERLLYSFVGRLNYEYAGKYLLSGSIRRDGLSIWAPGKKWSTFPSVSVGWRISDEEFFKNITQVSELKLRASYGSMGFTGLGDYPWQLSLVQQNTAPIFGGGRQQGSYIDALENRELEWEVTKMTNIGLDLGLFDNKLTLAAEYYVRKAEGLILEVPLSPSLGFSRNTPSNVGSMQNNGFEFVATYNKRTNDFKWDLSANFSTTKNKILNFGPDIKSPIFSGSNADYGGFDIARTRPGDPVQSFYGWKVDGIFQSQAEIDSYNAKDGNASTKYQDNAKPGDIRFKDLNGDGKITADDRTIIGNFIPDFTYGINFNGSYKNFDVNLFLQGSQGNEIYNGTKVLRQGMLRLFGAGKEVLNAWTPSNTNTDVPRAVDGDPNNNSRTSDRFIENGSYLRLKTLSVGYTIPEKTLLSGTKNVVKRARIYLSTQNLITITKYTGYDPEIGSRFNSSLTNGIDYGQFPSSRTVLLGVQLGF